MRPVGYFNEIKKKRNFQILFELLRSYLEELFFTENLS